MPILPALLFPVRGGGASCTDICVSLCSRRYIRFGETGPRLKLSTIILNFGATVITCICLFLHAVWCIWTAYIVILKVQLLLTWVTGMHNKVPSRGPDTAYTQNMTYRKEAVPSLRARGMRVARSRLTRTRVQHADTTYATDPAVAERNRERCQLPALLFVL